VSSNLRPEAQELAEYMSTLSQQAWCASWMAGLEFASQSAVVNGPCEYGRLEINDAHIAELRYLADAAGGWIIFDGDEGETLVRPKEWNHRFEVWKRQR
jgi:hypothetical protein